jgi:hypothetical protein
MHVVVARCPHTCRAGSAGITKKITNVTNVTAMNKTHAHVVRRTR